MTRTADNSRAFFASVLLHGAVLAVVVYFSYTAATEQAKKAPHILELVAGVGDNFRATEAPLLGTPGGVKLDIPKTTPTAAEPPRPEPPKPVTPKAEPAPTPPAPTKAAPKQTTQRTFLQQIKKQMIIGEVTAKRQVQKERDAEQKRQKEEAQKAKLVAKNDPKFERVSTEGITGGVVGGSKNNTKGGAGGNALTVAERSDAEAYTAYLNKLLTDELSQVTGLDEGLTCEASFEIMANGRLSHGKIVRSSRNERFDSAVLHAIASVRMSEGPPKGVDRVQSVTFHSQAKN